MLFIGGKRSLGGVYTLDSHDVCKGAELHRNNLVIVIPVFEVFKSSSERPNFRKNSSAYVFRCPCKLVVS